MAFCRQLEIRDLWIDSFCILQRDREDSGLQAAEMAMVYSQCSLNIVINVSADPKEGAFRERDPNMLVRCYVAWESQHQWFVKEDAPRAHSNVEPQSFPRRIYAICNAELDAPDTSDGGNQT